MFYLDSFTEPAPEMHIFPQSLGETEEVESINTLTRINNTPGTNPPAND